MTLGRRREHTNFVFKAIRQFLVGVDVVRSTLVKDTADALVLVAVLSSFFAIFLACKRPVFAGFPAVLAIFLIGEEGAGTLKNAAVIAQMSAN